MMEEEMAAAIAPVQRRRLEERVEERVEEWDGGGEMRGWMRVEERRMDEMRETPIEMEREGWERRGGREERREEVRSASPRVKELRPKEGRVDETIPVRSPAMRVEWKVEEGRVERVEGRVERKHAMWGV